MTTKKIKMYLKGGLFLALILFCPSFAGAQNTLSTPASKLVHGVVVDDQNQPVAGATITVKGTTKGTLTDENGKYSVKVSDGEVLTFSFIGYEKQQKKINSKTTVLDVKLASNSKALDEVVVVGYGTQKKVNLTGSVSSIDFSKQSQSRPITTVSQALSGLSPGVQVLQTSGQPGGDGASITVRGSGTLNNTKPLVIIDGMEGSMDNLNPQDIENITVLKDAAASAIYGAQAANGVILITTKVGKAGKVHVSYSGRFAYAEPMHLTDLVSDYADYMGFMNESYSNIGQSVPFPQSEIDTWRQKALDPHGLNQYGVPNYVAYPNTDWQKAFFKNSIQTEHDISVNGGSDKVHYMLSGDFLSNPGLVDNTGMKRYTIRANVESNINKWITAGMRTYGGLSDLDSGDFDNANSFLRQSSPGVYPMYNGLFGGPESAYESGNANNILYHLSQKRGSHEKTNFSTTLYSKIKPFKGFEWDFNLNYARHEENTNQENGFLIPTYSFSRHMDIIEPTSPNQMTTNFSQKYDYSYTLENILHYNVTINKLHDLGFLAGYQERYFFYRENAAQKMGLVDPSIYTPSSATTMQSITGKATDWATRSFFGRVNYAYASKYLVEADFREDGSSRYAKGHRYGFFPSFSAGWRLSEESFMENTRSFVNNLKIRASWGQLGNMGGTDPNDKTIGNYDYQSVYSLTNYSFNNAIVQGLSATGLPNLLLSWESTTMANIGVDFSALHNRLSLTADVYNKLTDGILYRPDIYLTMGNKTAPLKNIAKVRNRGVEFNLGWSDRVGKVQYSITGNFSYNQNMVTKYKGEHFAGWVDGPDGPVWKDNIGEVSTGSTDRIVEGKQIKEYYLQKVYHGNGQYFDKNGKVNPAGGPKDGMIRTKADMDWVKAMAAAGHKFYPKQNVGKSGVWYGDYIFADTNGDGVYGDSDDNTFMGTSSQPKYNFGLQASVSWNNFDLSFNFSGAAGFSIYDAASAGYNSTGLVYGDAEPKDIAYNHYFYDPDHPNDPRTNIYAKYPRLTQGASGFQNDVASDLYLYNGDFVKLRNLTVGYTIPKKVLKTRFIENLRFYFSGENLFCITSYPGQDPEMLGASKYATLRQFAFGINATF